MVFTHLSERPSLQISCTLVIFHLDKSCEMTLPFYGVVSIITRYESQQIKEYVFFFSLNRNEDYEW